MRLLALALALAVAAAGAGCIQVQVGAPLPEESPSSTQSASAASASSTTAARPGVLKADFTWSPQTPRVGQQVHFQGKAEGLNGHRVDAWAWDFGDNGTARTQAPSHTFAKPGERLVTLRIMTDDGRITQAIREVFVLNVGQSAPGAAGGNRTDNATEPAPPPTPGVFDCGGATVVEPNDTFGRDDSGLSWAALKTGFRLAVAWSTETQTTETLRYRVGPNGQERTVTEAAPTSLHLFVLDGLDEGSWACFTAGDHPTHAVRLVNAMTAYQPAEPHGFYTMNFLVLVNEGGDVGEVEPGLARYAQMLWDATDGWVRAGALLLVVGDYLHHNVGWPTCALSGNVPAACSNFYDAIVTEAANPAGAASTNRQGIRDPDLTMWMNMHWQAMPGTLSMDDFGAVLLHEAGHYAFDMDDLYGSNTVVTTECFDEATGVSIMAGSRDATEFDDPMTPCPNQPSGYTTSWELFQGQFRFVPDRPTGPVPGPSGDGGVAFVQTYNGL